MDCDWRNVHKSAHHLRVTFQDAGSEMGIITNESECVGFSSALNMALKVGF